MDQEWMAMWMCAGIIGLVVKVHAVVHECRDRRVLSLMDRGLGPDRYVTYHGMVRVNTQRLIKRYLAKRRRSHS